MKKRILASIVSIVAIIAGFFSAYLIFFKGGSRLDTQSNTLSSANQETNTTGSTNTTSSQTLTDGTYTGKAVSTEWGDVQLQITVSSGKISDIITLSYPDTEKKSEQINQRALPTYIDEALSAQSSSIDLVSGATETYKGFTGSLQDAINQAESATTS
ncbi:MAG: FMN-binding protein [Streptococcus orisratti]|uniref:FMN-binding protein n=1 Tax=Streptococcus orisratti TaxID=114652 RepID=UPI00235703A9|nr:FMN-binding protein [Streptococcus orisratti]MCI7677404.1 FMN-binding protein [Streptococcus orisratti]